MSNIVTKRNVWVTTPLEDGKLVLENMGGHESLGQPFNYELSLLSNDYAIDLSTLLGQPMTVHVMMGTGKIRFFNGIVTAASQVDSDSGFAQYTATLQPWLALLDYGADCRIYQNTTIPSLLKDVFRRAGFSDFEDTLDAGAYKELEYCVQYRESDFHFVSRLMEHEGIYYFFKHEEKKHTLILADGFSAHQPQPGYETVDYKPPKDMSRTDREHVSSWNVARQMRAGGYASTDFNFQTPRAALLSASQAPPKQEHPDYEVFDYPGDFLAKDGGDARVKMRLQERQWAYELAQTSGDARGPGAGNLFKLADFPGGDEKKDYLVVSASYLIQAGEYESTSAGGAKDEFHVTMTVMDSQVPYRPTIRFRKFRVEGPQTAIVVGPSGSEIHTDKYGRVMLQFHWDRYGMSDEHSSCWVRVSQAWAGATWGAIHIPRIGQEVIVDFLEGDPDRPIITGRVYNAVNMPPYDLPANKTRSGIKSRSTTGGGPANFNELRFEDKKGSEQVYLHAEKDQDNMVENDDSLTVGHDRTKAIGNDETTTVGGNRTETVSKDETVTINQNQTLTVAIDRSHTVGANQTISVGANETVSVGANSSDTIGIMKSLTVGAVYAIEVGAAMTVSVGAAASLSVGGGSSEDVGGDKSVSAAGDVTESAGGGVTITAGKDAKIGASDDFVATAGKDGRVEAADQLTLTCGDASIVLKKNGDIVINGNKITVKASDDLVMKGSKVTQN